MVQVRQELNGGGGGGDCSTDADCPSGEVCDDGTCVPALQDATVESCSLSPTSIAVGDTVTLSTTVSNPNDYEVDVTVSWTTQTSAPMQTSATGRVAANSSSTLSSTITISQADWDYLGNPSRVEWTTSLVQTTFPTTYRATT